MPPDPSTSPHRGDADQEDLVFRGCLWFTAFAWIAPILCGLLLGLAIYGALG